MAEATNVSYRYALEEEQGTAFIENTGDDWVFPESETSGMIIYDSDGLAHNLICDNKDGLFYDIMGREGPSGSNVSKIWKDKSTTGSDGTDVVPELTFPEDRGTYEHFFIGHLNSHIYMRPYSETDGYPTGLQVDLDIYEDGEPTTITAEADDIPEAGDVTYDRDVDAHRLQTKLTANMGEHIITGRQQYYKSQDTTAEPANTNTTEMGYQEAFSEPSQWIDIIGSDLIDRSSSALITGQTYTAVTDPVSTTKGLEIAAAITFPSVALTGAGVVLIWYNGTIALTIGGNAVALTDHSTTAVGTYKLAYANTLTKSGAVVITPTGTAKIWDLRILNSAISTNQRTYYYNDIKDNSGKVFVIP